MPYSTLSARRCPPTEPDALDDDQNAGIVAYILSRNGFVPGATPLPADESKLLKPVAIRLARSYRQRGQPISGTLFDLG
jgi:hypothetical protein